MHNNYLFRGKRIDNGEWVVGCYLDGSYMKEDWALICPEMDISICNDDKQAFSCGSFYFVDPATLGRCTDLRDRNGKLIYEGDIYRDSLGLKAVAKWDKANARFLGITIENEPRIAYVSKYPAVEIIGNIHDNPDC